MLTMTKKKPESADKPPRKTPRYPSRDAYTSVTISKKLADQIRAIANAQERSVAFIIKKACEAYIKAYRNNKS